MPAHPYDAVLQRWLESAKPPKWLWRSIAAIVLGGQVATRILKGEPATAAPQPYNSSVH